MTAYSVLSSGVVLAAVAIASTLLPTGIAYARDVWSRGGEMESYMQRVRAAKRSGEALRLRRCDSVCTMYLSANSCVLPSSRLGFHRSYAIGPNGENVYDREARRYDAMMWASYPNGVKRLLGSLTPGLRYLTGRQLIAAGVRACGR
jgi:hypothetical protein